MENVYLCKIPNAPTNLSLFKAPGFRFFVYSLFEEKYVAAEIRLKK